MVFDLTRQQWNARPPRGSYQQIAMTNRPGYEGHHSVGLYGASSLRAFVRAVQADHLGRGWTDIFYNTLVWPDGTVAEGRPWGATSGSVRHLTVCLAGNYHSRKMTVEMKQACVAIRDEARRRGIGQNITWHAARAATTCPGQHGIAFFRDMTSFQPAPLEPGDRIMRLVSPYMRGEDVYVWQRWLNDFRKAFRLNAIDTDGVFGPQTAAATSHFMRVRMGVETQDPRVGPRTVEEMMIWRKKQEDGKGRDEPDFVVAVLASNDVDEGIARVLGKRFRWRFLRYPEEALDYSVGTAVLVGAVGAMPDPHWADVRILTGANRDETAKTVEAYMHKDGDSRRAPKV